MTDFVLAYLANDADLQGTAREMVLKCYMKSIEVNGAVYPTGTAIPPFWLAMPEPMLVEKNRTTTKVENIRDGDDGYLCDLVNSDGKSMPATLKLCQA